MSGPFIIVYKTVGQFEWGNKYYYTIAGGGTVQAIAAQLAAAEAGLTHETITANRFEAFDPAGHKVAEGPLSQQGLASDERMPLNYAMLLRFVVAGEQGRPSTKFIHGFSEAFTSTDGITTSGQLAIVAYRNLILDAGVQNSDEQPVVDVVFRNFTRRKRMRRKL